MFLVKLFSKHQFKKKILPLALTSSQTQSVRRYNIQCEVQPNTQKTLETLVHKIRIITEKVWGGMSSEKSYVMSHEL